MATLESRTKKTLKHQADILGQLNRIEEKLDELLTRPEGGTSPAAERAPATPVLESASTLDLTATNKSIEGGNAPSPKPKGR